jgi:hypothetical protein
MAIVLKNPGVITFTGTILKSDKAVNSWAWVEFPYDLKELYGKGTLVPVIVTYDDIPYQGSITKMNTKAMLLIKRDILSRLSKKKGDPIEVTVTLDDKPRTIKIPLELGKAFKKNTLAKEYFDTLSYSHRKEYVQWVVNAKQESTRQRRAEKTIAMLIESKKTS